MKVFVPISDSLLSDRGELSGTLVPFTPDLLVNRAEQKEKRALDHWISSSDLLSASHQLSSNPKLS